MASESFGPGIRLWAASELRRRWASLVVLGVLGGLAAGLAIAAYDGAQRSGTAYTRMRDELHAADVVAFPSQIEIGDFDPYALDDAPEVESWGGFALNPSAIDGYEQYGSPFITVGDGWFTTLEGAKLIEGRLPDPDSDAEAVITEPVLEDDSSLTVGATLTWRNLSLQQAEQFQYAPPPTFDWRTAEGVTTELTIVGIVRLPMELVASFASDGMLLTGPGWAKAHFDEAPIFFTNPVIRLRHGEDDIPALRQTLTAITDTPNVPVKNLWTDIKRVQRSLDVERTALMMFSLTVALTGLVLVGQAIVRATAAGAASVPALRAMGASSISLALGLAAPVVVSIATSVVVAAVVGIVATHWFPVGLARRVDPDPGIHLDGTRLAAGLALTAVLIALVVIAAAASMQRTTDARRPRRALLMSWATRSGVGLPTALGTSLALDAGPGRTRRSRLAVLASIAGVVAVVGALTLVEAIDDTADHPERTGANWDMLITGDNIASEQEAFEVGDADDDIAAMALLGRRALEVGGADVPVFGLKQHKGRVDFTVTEGRAPFEPDELALGPATMRLLDAEIGDTIAVGPDEMPMEVVGEALLVQEPHSSFDEGAWLSQAAYEMIVPPENGSSYDDVLVKVVEGIDPEVVAADLPPTWSAAPPAASADVNNLVQVRRLPIYLAGFLALLAVGAVAHALFTGVRERARELAVLRALGVTPRQAAASVTWQALVTGVLALAFGLPIGIVIGQRVWRAITDELSFVYVGPIATAVIAAAVPICIGACLLLAIAPARGTARRPITTTLREE